MLCFSRVRHSCKCDFSRSKYFKESTRIWRSVIKCGELLWFIFAVFHTKEQYEFLKSEIRPEVVCIYEISQVTFLICIYFYIHHIPKWLCEYNLLE